LKGAILEEEKEESKLKGHANSGEDKGSKRAAHSKIKRQGSEVSCDSGDDIEKQTKPGDILYPDIIKRQASHMRTFHKQFNDVIER